jgi:hypothetical protein
MCFVVTEGEGSSGERQGHWVVEIPGSFSQCDNFPWNFVAIEWLQAITSRELL